MKIIDSHLHYCPGSPYFDEIAVRAEHINSGEHLREQYQIYEIETGVVMGNRGLSFAEHDYPDFLHYCIGIDSHYLKHHDISDAHDMIEQHLQRDACAGISSIRATAPFISATPDMSRSMSWQKRTVNRLPSIWARLPVPTHF